MSIETRGSSLAPDSGFAPDCVICRSDLEVLLQGAEYEREIGYRNLSIGIAASCGFGTFSSIAPRFSELVSAGLQPLESLLLMLLCAVTLASSALALFFHRRLQLAGSRGVYRAVDRHVRARLEEPVELEDPRRWP